ncbi:twin-arginine translocation signal domain-containing protein, partial [Persicitalea sp.]|uniref:twin-arginine translocation signal domain-containing protein n=1 Tax=Persicitalea sp. TaxID=3100273 RepID=UPI0035938D1C
MPNSRRNFLKSGAVAMAGANALFTPESPQNVQNEPDYARLDAALKEPVLKKDLFSSPVIIQSCDLLEYNGNYICRVRSTDGAVGYCVGHNLRMPHLYLMQVLLVNPFFIGKDARQLDQLIEGVMVHQNNYKYQGYAIWIPIA